MTFCVDVNFFAKVSQNRVRANDERNLAWRRNLSKHRGRCWLSLSLNPWGVTGTMLTVSAEISSHEAAGRDVKSANKGTGRAIS